VLSYDLQNSSIFSARLKVCSDGNDVIAGGNMFQTLAAATWSAAGGINWNQKIEEVLDFSRHWAHG